MDFQGGLLNVVIWNYRWAASANHGIAQVGAQQSDSSMVTETGANDQLEV